MGRACRLVVGLLVATSLAAANGQRAPLPVEPPLVEGASPFQLSLGMTVVPIVGGLLVYETDHDLTPQVVGLGVAALGLIEGPAVGYMFGRPKRAVRGLAGAVARLALSLEVGDILQSSRLKHTAVPYIVGALVPASAVYDIASLSGDAGHSAKLRLSSTIDVRMRRAGLALTVTQ